MTAGAEADAGAAAASCRFEPPLQEFPTWRDDGARPLATLSLPDAVVGIGGDDRGGFWVLAGRDRAHLVHLDPSGEQLSDDDLQVFPDSVRLLAGPEAAVAGRISREVAIDLAGLSLGGAGKDGIFVVRRTATGLALLAQLDWDGEGNGPTIHQVATSSGGDIYYLLLQLQGGAGTLSSGTLRITVSEVDPGVVVGIGTDGRVRFMRLLPDPMSVKSLGPAANDNLLVVAESRIEVWDQQGQKLSQFAIPDAGLFGDLPLLRQDAAGNTYAAMMFEGEARLGAQTWTPHGFAYDILLLKFGLDGSLLWSQQLGGNGDERPGALAFDGQGNLILAGTFAGSSDFGTGPLVSNPGLEPETGYWSEDAYIARFAPDGKPLDSLRYGTDGTDRALALLPVGNDEAWLCVMQASPMDEYDSAQAVRLSLDAMSAAPGAADLREPFQRLAGPADVEPRLVAVDDWVLVGPSLTLLQSDGTKLEARGELERPSDAPAWFGNALAATRELIVVGGAPALPEWVSFELAPGAVHVYERDGDHFSHRSQLAVPSPAPAGFGRAVAVVDGNIFVSTTQGSVYGFEREGDTWRQSVLLTATGEGVRENFGWAVAARGADLAIGHPGFKTPDNHAGAVYIYRRSGGEWRMQQQITSALAPPATTECHDRGCSPITYFGFGENLAATEHTLLVSTGEQAMVSVFDGEAYRHVLTLGDPNSIDASSPPALQGTPCGPLCSEVPLTVRGDLFALGSPGEDVALTRAAGTVRVYQRVGDTWLERGRLRSGDPTQGGLVGTGVALYDGGLAIGAPGERGGNIFDLPLTPAECR